MANRFGRSVGAVKAFEPKGASIENLPGVQRGAGQDAEALFGVGAELAGVFGQMADRAAKIEGKAAGEVAGNDPNWRPSGATTIRGHAFDEAAMSTYLDRLDASISRRTREAFQSWSEDPNRTVGGLSESFNEIRDDVLANDSFDQIKGRVSAQFERLRTPFEIQAQKDAFERVQDGRRRAGFERINEGQTTVARVAALDPSSPATEKAVATELKSQIAVIEQMARNGDITQEAAGKQIAAVKQATALQIGKARIGKYADAASLDEAEKTLDREFAAGRLPQLDAGSHQDLKATFAKRREQITAQGNRDKGLIEGRVDSMVSRAKQGFEIPDTEMMELRVAAGRTPQGAAAFDVAERKMKLAANLRGQSPEAIDAFARMMRDEIRRGGGKATPAQDDLIKFVDEYGAARKKSIEVAPLRDADRNGVLKVVPFDFSNIEQLETSTARRVAEAQAVAKSNGREPVYFDPDELARTKAVIAQGGDVAVEAIKRVVAGAGKAAPAILAEIGANAKELAHAGALLSKGLPQQVYFARDILEGQRLKSIQDARLPSLDKSVDDEVFARVFGKSLADQPENRERLRAAARAAYAVRAARGNVVKGTAGEDELLERTYREAAGLVTVRGQAYGGVDDYSPRWFAGSEKVTIPQMVKKGRLNDVIGAVQDKDYDLLPGRPVRADGTTLPAADLKNYFPVPAKGGYAFAYKNSAHEDRQYLRSSNGGKFVLEFDKLEDVLQRRVPDAFLGAR